ncbi:MAG: pyruvate:ferredoxin (flavodoxin) oxidoreductase, partial [Clostridiales bacterium]|nr:pyruvate:ferredoxin (flavodoxin) oxidoreductase [Clostridiales bacterium]
MSKITIDGNTAAATIAYQFSDAATIYPITPSSTMAELCDQWASEGRKNIFGNTVKVVEMQSEAGASGALHGSLAAGALTTTFTASQGLLLMIPNMYKIAGELTPCVMHVSARALATHALSIFGDHSDVMSVRQCGWAMLASGSVQEAMDMALVSHIATLKSNVPFVHFFDGFRTSHEINTIEDIDVEKMKSIVPWDNINEFRLRSLNSNNPHQQGTAQNPDIYFQNRESTNAFYQRTPDIVQDTMNEVAKITGRKYNLFDYYGAKDAKYVIVSMGSSTTTIELTIDYLNKVYGNKYGLIKVRLYRPFATSVLLSALPDSVEKIAVLDRTKEPGADGEPLYKDVVAALFDSKFKNVEVVGGRYGLGSKEFTPSMVKAVFDNLENEKSKNGFTVGINDDLTNTSLEIKNIIHPDSGDVTECKFYGFGGDGTVSANKSSIKIIGNNTEYDGQAYFEYDSKKSGNATISHIRFGKGNINQSYMLDNIDFVAVHNQSYVTKYNILKNVKDHATLLLNTEWDMEHIDKFFPNALKKDIATRGIKLYTIDAVDIAKRLGLGNKINLIMQSAFFKLIGIMPYDKAIDEMKAFAKKAYAKAGEEAYNNNCKAIDSAKDELNEIKIPEEWKNINTSDEENTDQSYSTDKYYTDIMQPVQRLDGDS